MNISTDPLEPERKKSLRESYGENYPRLQERLLSIGGEACVMPVLEEDYQKIMLRGDSTAPTPDAPLVFKKGANCHCHANSARLYEKHKRYSLCTGYALSQDGVWRPHSWCRNGKRIVETTTPRLVYFGFTMTKEEAEEFSYSNW
jgi:hypothetical protein